MSSYTESFSTSAHCLLNLYSQRERERQKDRERAIERETLKDSECSYDMTVYVVD